MDKINLYVNALLQRREDWPPARELGEDEFIDQTLSYIKKRLQVTQDQAVQIALRIWGTLMTG